jgi:putative protease
MCHSFSGLCLFSGIELGRSANRGECAQPCRTWFEGPAGKTYCFSSNDLALETLVKKYAKTGIDSLKIEGRMKSPEYTAAACSMYKKILAGEDYGKDCEKLYTVFSRKRSTAFFTDKKGFSAVNTEYPGHRGIFCGKITGAAKFGLSLKTSCSLSVHDTLSCLSGSFPPEEIRIPVTAMKAGGRNIIHIQAGNEVFIKTSSSVPVGTELYKTASGTALLPSIKAENFPAYKYPLIVDASLNSEGLHFYTSGQKICSSVPATEKSTGGKSFKAILRAVLEASGNYDFFISLNASAYADTYSDTTVYINPSSLKNIRKFLYEAAAAFLCAKEEKHKKAALSMLIKPENSRQPGEKFSGFTRSGIFDPAEPLLPFIESDFPANPEKLYNFNGSYYFSLNPLLFDESAYFKKLEYFVSSFPDVSFCAGLNNPAHISRAAEYAHLKNLCFFADYALYTANRSTDTFIKTLLPSVEFSLYWVEDRDKACPPYAVKADRAFNPPLFTSRNCFMRNNYGCPAGCQRNYVFTLKQNKNEYTVLVKNCISFVLKNRSLP